MIRMKRFAAVAAITFGALGVAQGQVALTINNASFEADTPTPPHGYRSSITGWTMSAGNFGVNTSPGSFMDNGIVPDGAQVLFIQQPASATQNVAGFLAMQPYTLKVRVNSRASTIPAIVRLSVGGTEIVPPTPVATVGGTNPFTLITKNFQKTTAGAYDLTIENTNGPADNTLLVDLVEIVPGPPNAASADWLNLE